MLTYHDYTQLIKVSQRRLTAAWHDRTGESVWVTPRVAREAAEGIRVWDLERSVEQWEEDLKLHTSKMTESDQMVTKVKIWWATQWLHPNQLYRVRVLSNAEQNLTEQLVEQIPKNGFTCHPSEVSTHPDTWIVCEALATGGQVLVTRNLGTLRRGIINQWVAENQQRFGVRNRNLIVSSDEWMKENLGGLGDPESQARGARLAIAAFCRENCRKLGRTEHRNPRMRLHSSRRTRCSAARWLFGLPRLMARWRPRPELGVPEQRSRR